MKNSYIDYKIFYKFKFKISVFWSLKSIFLNLIKINLIIKLLSVLEISYKSNNELFYFLLFKDYIDNFFENLIWFN